MIDAIKKELLDMADEKVRQKAARFFKESEHNRLGIKTAQTRKLSSKYYKQIKHLPKAQVLEKAEQLLEWGPNDAKVIAFDWAFKQKRNFEKSDFETFQRWAEKYLNDWGAVDDFSTHALGYFIMKYPRFIDDLKQWARSDHTWMKRASAVALIYSARRDENIDQAFEIADILFNDPHDLVQKGCGWLLKEVSKKHPDRVFDYVMKNKGAMPRTALRYAIEKLPENKRKKAMEK